MSHLRCLRDEEAGESPELSTSHWMVAVLVRYVNCLKPPGAHAFVMFSFSGTRLSMRLLVAAHV